LDAYEKRETLRMLKVRTYTYRDWHQVWPVIRAIVLEQETFVYDPAMIEEDARSMLVDVGKPQPDPTCWRPGGWRFHQASASSSKI
jgi:hypothetical protein